jgi:predicted PurR-regulated permease PerM
MDWESIAKKLIRALENSRISEMAWYLGDTKKIIRSSFISGLFRGLGMAIGFSVLGAIALVLLGQIFGMDFK